MVAAIRSSGTLPGVPISCNESRFARAEALMPISQAFAATTVLALTPTARAKHVAALVQVDLATAMSKPDAAERHALLREAGIVSTYRKMLTRKATASATSKSTANAETIRLLTPRGTAIAWMSLGAVRSYPRPRRPLLVPSLD